jgi:hypothetical protein
MSMPPPPGAMPQETAWDLGNLLLAQGPARFIPAIVETPSGQMMTATFRTQSTTLTLYLAKADADIWAKLFTDTANKLSKSGLIIANGQLPPDPGGKQG